MAERPIRKIQLRSFEEIVGDLNELKDNNGLTEARIGNISVILPLEIKLKLRPLMGSKVAILHTDIPQKEYLIRSVNLKDQSEYALLDDDYGSR